jgi:hypothetical protein
MGVEARKSGESRHLRLGHDIWVFEAQIIFGFCYTKIVFLERLEFIIHLQVMSEKIF